MMKFQKLHSLSRLRGLIKNSQIVRFICSSLIENDIEKPLGTILSKYSINDLFEETKLKLREDDSFVRINSKFFDPLKDYLIANNYNEKDFVIKSQGSQAYINTELNTVSIFLFTSDFVSNLDRIINLHDEYLDSKFVIYCPIDLDLSYSNLIENKISKVEIVEYDPESLMTLFVMFRDENLEYGLKIKKAVFEYTKRNL